MRQLICLALVIGFARFFTMVQGQEPATDSAQSYRVEVTVWEMGGNLKKTAICHQRVHVKKGHWSDADVAGVVWAYGDRRWVMDLETKEKLVGCHLRIACTIAEWDKDRVALTGSVQGNGIDEVHSRKVTMERHASKLVRPAQSLMMSIARFELLPEQPKDNGRFAVEFRIQEDAVDCR